MSIIVPLIAADGAKSTITLPDPVVTATAPTLQAVNVTDTTANLQWTPAAATVTEVGRDGVDSTGTGAWKGAPSALPFTYLTPDTTYNLYAIINGTKVTVAAKTQKPPTTPPTPTPIPPTPSGGTTYLPFDLPATLSTKIVTAHVTPWFPVSLNNGGYPDTYDTQFIAPDSNQYGGQMRDRPYKVPNRPLPGDWALTDARSEVAQAKSVGIDAFYIDMVGLAHKPTVDKLYAAAAMDGFKCLPGGDMSGGTYNTSTPQQMAADFLPYLTHQAAFKLPDGRPLVGCFMAEARPVQWWTDFKAACAGSGVNVALSLTCLNGTNIAAYGPLCWGIGQWGGRMPPWTTPAATQSFANAAKSAGAKFMASIAFQDVRPYSIGNPFWWESLNHQTLRNCWDGAVAQSEIVQITTWNDYREGTQVARSQDCGWTRLDRLAWDIHRYKYGTYPTIVRDSVMCNHRKQFTTSKQTCATETAAFPQRDPTVQPASDRVEVEVWATAAATLTTKIGANTYTEQVARNGFARYDYPLATGQVSVQLVRNGVTVYSATSPHTVTNAPYVLDYEYKVFVGLR